MKKVVVISLGGSLIVPEEVDSKFLDSFKKAIKKNTNKWKFVVVCGGGVIARKYITALKYVGKSGKDVSLAGIMATRMNARFMMMLFGKNSDSLPKSMEAVKNSLKKNDVVFCGALRYSPKATSDETAAKLAKYLKCSFINMTDVKGLYSDNPKTNKNAKFIKHESWKDFEKRALGIKFKAGQHFVLDQGAAVLIRKHKVSTYIVGKDMKNLDKIINGKDFEGTLING